jgi:superfamily II RNA helicase
VLVIDLLRVLQTLDASDALPAIVFCLDRTVCQDVVRYMSVWLQRAERKAWHRDGSALRWAQACEQYVLHEHDVARLQENVDKLVKDLGGDGGVDAAELRRRLEKHREYAQPRPVDPRFTFCKPAQYCLHVRAEMCAPADEQHYWFSRVLNKCDADALHPYLLALERGIGVHHAGMPKAYLDLVEVLFRERKLRVVVATGTLALGLNMPCRTAVFLGDSPHLTPVSFRQMSGRAGRRGFDDEGRVNVLVVA